MDEPLRKELVKFLKEEVDMTLSLAYIGYDTYVKFSMNVDGHEINSATMLLSEISG